MRHEHEEESLIRFDMENFDTIHYLILFIAGVSFFLLEMFFDFRERSESAVRHQVRNLLFGFLNSGFVGLFYIAVLVSFQKLATVLAVPSLYGLAWQMEVIPQAVVIVVFFLLFDITLYFWHRANHELPILWRFHRVHHSDEDLDFSSALRFHAGELAISALVKGVFVFVFGVPILIIAIFDLLVTVFAMYNHANLSMYRTDKVLRKFIVTPDMHRVHHSRHVAETNSNYTTILSFWDRIFGTYVSKSQQSDKLGLVQYSTQKSRAFARLFSMPFRK